MKKESLLHVVNIFKKLKSTGKVYSIYLHISPSMDETIVKFLIKITYKICHHEISQPALFMAF